MKSLCGSASIVLLALFSGCQQQQRVFTGAEQEATLKAVRAQFDRLVSAINQKDAGAWSEFYSKEGFVSATVGTDCYATRSAWVDAITKYFSMRERQRVEPLRVRVTALAPDVALMTSEERSVMGFKNGQDAKAKHVFTMIWKKESGGWKILHSHESWVEEPAR